MLYPSIQELLTATSKDGKERLNKYSITMATAKCARMITNDYSEQRHIAERKSANKESEKEIAAVVKKEYRDEKAVKNALREMKAGEYEVYLPGEEGYETSFVEIKDYVEPKEEPKYFKPMIKKVAEDIDEDTDEELDEELDSEEELDSVELMGASEIFDNDAGYSVEDAE